ncbi:hypothetical protein PG984_013375 [Apiospora sp. TS-2023a]
MSTFHPFPRLPLELRQQIWALAVEPRLVVVDDCEDQNRTPPPPILGIYSEARSFLLQNCYTKAFMISDSAQYHYVNFEIDTIHLDQLDLVDRYPREHHWIQQLSVCVWNAEEFMYGHGYHLADMTALKSVTVNNCDTLEGDREQWNAWESDMKKDFFRDGPVPYSVLIVGLTSSKACAMRFHPNHLATSQYKLTQYNEETKTLCQNTPEPNDFVLFFYLKLEYNVDAASLGQDAGKDPGCVMVRPDPYNKGVYMHSGETPKREARRPASSNLSLWRATVSVRGAKHDLSRTALAWCYIVALLLPGHRIGLN